METGDEVPHQETFVKKTLMREVDRMRWILFQSGRLKAFCFVNFVAAKNLPFEWEEV